MRQTEDMGPLAHFLLSFIPHIFPSTLAFSVSISIPIGRLRLPRQVFEFVDTDLYKLIGSPQFLTDEHIKLFLYQMLIGLKYVHSAHVIHRDIKVRRFRAHGRGL